MGDIEQYSMKGVTMKFYYVKYFIAALTCVLFIPFFVTADDNSIEPGMFSMQFQIAELLRLNDLHGMMLSGKYHSSERTAFRLGFDISISSLTRDDESTRTDWDEQFDLESALESERNIYSVALFGQFMRYAQKSSSVYIYYGIGPLIRYRRDTQDERIYQSDQLRLEIESISSSFAGGITGSIGVEWFASSVISFLAEYGAEAMYSRTESEIIQDRYDQEETVVQERTTSAYTLQRRSVRFGVSIYF